MSVTRGQIFYIEKSYSQVGSEQADGRPAIIVSSDENNRHSPTVEVVYLTTQPKKDLPTHVEIRSARKLSTALCEQISTVSVDRVGDYIGTCSDAEMKAIDIALEISLGICSLYTTKDDSELKEVAISKQRAKEDLKPVVKPEELIRAETERDVYKSLYEKLLSKAV